MARMETAAEDSSKMEAKNIDTESVRGTRLCREELARTLTAGSVEEEVTAAMAVEGAAVIPEVVVAKVAAAGAATCATMRLQL